MGIKKIKNAIRRIGANSRYLKALKADISSKTLLLESGQGRGEGADLFALFDCNETLEAIEKKYKVYVSVALKSKKPIAKALKNSGYEKKVHLIERNSVEYRQALATAGLIVVDDALPDYYIKREGQKIIFQADRLNDLKQGRSNPDKMGNLGLVQKSILSASKLISKKENFSAEEFKKEYFLGQGNIDRLYYVGDLSRETNRYLAIDSGAHAIAFENGIKSTTIDFLLGLDEEVAAIQIPTGGAISLIESIGKFLYRKYRICAAIANKFYEREYARLFAWISMDELHFLSSELYERMEIIKKSNKKKVAHRLPLTLYRKLSEAFYTNPSSISNGYTGFDQYIEYSKDYGKELWKEDFCFGVFVRLKNLKLTQVSENIVLKGKLIVRADREDLTIEPKLVIGSMVYKERFPYHAKLNNLTVKEIGDEIYQYSCNLEVEIPKMDVAGWFIKNLPIIQLKSGDMILNVPILSEKRAKIYNITGTDYAWENRVDKQHIRFVIKTRMVTDRKLERIKLDLAFALSRITFWYRPVIIYEKNCRNYEESGSILFEKLVDSGYKKAKYILNKDSFVVDAIQPKYKKQIVNQFSFAHYYNLFAAKSIFSSEAIGHSLEKGSGSWLFNNFIMDGSKNYVFLQHGVMYMVALSSEQRAFFAKGKGKGKQRVVVSSKLESDHFTDNTNYEPEDIYISGLLKFDKSLRNDDADKILVMLTWRPWEFVTGLNDMKETGYYKMLQRIVRSVPDNLKSRLIVVPHPLVIGRTEMNSEDEVWQYYKGGVKYDDLLKETKLLITDYSSISYDAFYRGCNVIFNWEEKDQCMKNYGENGHLMLTEDLAFGDVIYNSDNLRDAICKGYEEAQSEIYLKNFSKLVEHHDGKNCERFIKMAKKDGLL